MRRLLGILAVVGALGAFTTATVRVELSLSSTAPARGCIRLAIFDCPRAFAHDESHFGEVLELSGVVASNLRLQLPPLAAGTYVIAVYHDLNNNGRLDRNVFGIPTEPYGFSKEPTNKWQKPSWEDIATPITPSTKHLSIVLKTWKERS